MASRQVASSLPAHAAAVTGVWCLKAELEDLAFSVLHPEEYKSLRALAASRQDPALLEQSVLAIKAGMDAAGIKYAEISGRPKNLYGIWKKMNEGGITSLDKVGVLATTEASSIFRVWYTVQYVPLM